MKLLTFAHDNQEEIGVLNPSETAVIPLRFMFEEMGMACPESMNDLIDMWDTDVEAGIEHAKVHHESDAIPLDEILLKAPIPYPKRNLFCLGKNYLDHALETQGLAGGSDDIPKFPIYFSKVANPAVGQGAMILNHASLTDKVDYEVELAVVIGREGVDIPREEAEDYVFGYTIVNDISARNIQRKHGQWFKGKCLDTHCPMGPWIVHKKEIPFPVELNIQCWVNDELRQNSNTKHLIFDIPTIISDLSKGMKLEKGDVIITGTPSGVGLGFKPFKFLKSKDVIRCRIDQIGELQNHFE